MFNILLILAYTVFFFIGIYLFYKKEIFAIYIVAIYMLSSTLTISGIFIRKIPFYNIKLFNVILLMMTLVSIFKVLKNKINLINIIFILILVLNFTSLYRGYLSGYSSREILLEADLYIPFIIVCFYVYNCKYENMKKVIKVLKYAGLILVSIAIIRSILLGVGINVYKDLDGRVLYATDVSILSLLCIYEFYNNKNKKALFLLLSIILLRHRTIWISTAIGFFTFYILNKKVKIKQIYILSLISVIFISFHIYFNPSFNNKIFVNITNSAEEMFSERSTFQWRIKSMKFLTTKEYMENCTNILIGKPYGSGYRRYQGEMYRNEPAHDNYVELYNRIGIIGLMLNLLIYISIIYKAFKNKKIRYILPYVIIILVYYITYSGNIWQAVCVGIIANLSEQSKKDTCFITGGTQSE